MTHCHKFHVFCSDASINLVLWNANAESFNGNGHPVLLIKSARVAEYNGSKLLTIGSSSMLIQNPDCAESKTLRNWFDNGGDRNVVTEQTSI